MAIMRSPRSRKRALQRNLPLDFYEGNELVRAELVMDPNPTPTSYKLFELLIATLEPDKFPEVSLRAVDVVKSPDLGGHNYDLIEKAVKTIAGMLVKFTWTRPGKRPNYKYRTIFHELGYKDGLITGIFQDWAKEQILDLQERGYYTLSNWFDIAALSSSFYSQRLFKLSKSFEEPHGYGEITIEDLYKQLAYPQNMRKDFASFRRKALEQAEKDIKREIADYFFAWRAEKHGRKVAAVTLFAGDKGRRAWIAAQKEQQPQSKKPGRKPLPDKVKAEAIARNKILATASACRKRIGVIPGDEVKSYCIRMGQRPPCKSCQEAGIKKGPATEAAGPEQPNLFH